MLANAEGNTSAQHDSMRCPSRRLPIAINHIRSLLKPLAQLHALLIPSIIPTHPPTHMLVKTHLVEERTMSNPVSCLPNHSNQRTSGRWEFEGGLGIEDPVYLFFFRVNL